MCSRYQDHASKSHSFFFPSQQSLCQIGSIVKTPVSLPVSQISKQTKTVQWEGYIKGCVTKHKIIFKIEKSLQSNVLCSFLLIQGCASNRNTDVQARVLQHREIHSLKGHNYFFSLDVFSSFIDILHSMQDDWLGIECRPWHWNHSF